MARNDVGGVECLDAVAPVDVVTYLLLLLLKYLVGSFMIAEWMCYPMYFRLFHLTV